MNLRKLEVKDAPLMLEWMHDESVVKDLQTNFATKTLADCEYFIMESNVKDQNLHMAIVNDNDEYMGTVSLKNIHDTSAEFAITIRKCAMGMGYAQYGMKEIIKIGFKKMGIKSIYWCVNSANQRALNFYDKNGYQRIENLNLFSNVSGYSSEQILSYIWYQINNDF